MHSFATQKICNYELREACEGRLRRCFPSLEGWLRSRRGVKHGSAANPAARRPCLCDYVGVGFKPALMGTGRGTPVKKRYRYTGKEKDEESGLYYFGARYYSSATGIFISADPLLEKYPNVSPYAYCMNNPVKYIDPTGEEVQVIFEEENGEKQTVQYKDGKLYTLDGNEYTGNNKYANAVLKDLNQLSKDHKVLKDRLDDLVNSENIHTIEKGVENKIKYNGTKARKGKPTGSRIWYNPDINKGDHHEERAQRAGLAHELLGHAWDYNKGTSKYGEVNGIDMRDIDAVNIENIVRDAAGNDIRKSYSGKPIPEHLLHDANYIQSQDASFRASQESFLNKVKRLPEKINQKINQKLNSMQMDMYKHLLKPYF